MKLSTRTAADTVIAAALALLCALVYGAALRFGALNLDDPKHVFENPLIVGFGWSSLKEIWRASYFSLYIPLTYTVWGLVSSAGLTDLAGSQAAPFHALPVLFHAANAFLLFLIATRADIGKNASFLVAALFLVHPLQAESVFWISGLKDTLSGFFCLLSLYLSIREKRGLSLVSFLLAVLSKPSAIAFAFVAGVFEIVFLARDRKETALKFLPWLFLAFPFAFLTMSLQAESPAAAKIAWYLRPLVALDAYAFYLKKLVLPWPLVIDYARSPAAVLKSGVLFFSWAAPVTLVIWLLFRRERILLGGLFLCALVLLPVSGLVSFSFQKFSTVCDRYAYLVVAFFCLALAKRAGTLSPAFRRLAGLISCVILVLFSILTIQQGRKFRSSEELFAHALRHSPESLLAHTNYAYELFHRKQYARALRHLEKSVSLEPENAELRMSLGSALLMLGESKRGLEELQRSVEINAGSAISQHYLARAYSQVGDAAQAERHFAIASKLDPNWGRNRGVN